VVRICDFSKKSDAVEPAAVSLSESRGLVALLAGEK
jgi:hypothetical protein